ILHSNMIFMLCKMFCEVMQKILRVYILLKNGEVVQEKSQCHYAAGWPSRRISDCGPHFQNRKIYPFAGNNDVPQD
ncbi:hypothetical protein Q7368_11350, partial [Glaesserella parasuis]|nr:hypothetical protein [Glaesserella parasuis]